MFSQVFLAMTPGEIPQNPHRAVAYMACHFSSWGKGLSNLPLTLPAGSIILVDDSMPLTDHDPERITRQLQTLIEQFQPSAVLMDFQRPPTEAALEFLDACIGQLTCPVAVPIAYAEPFSCPVFLSPPPFDRTLGDYFAPWLERGIYLELALDGITVTVDASGSRLQPLPPYFTGALPLQDNALHCHYDVETADDQAIFTLSRTHLDIADLLKEAVSLGIRGAVGLYREFG
ncbi:MAG: hypothetical protein IJB47_07615 [Oscillospiraceae bacterium]|nr:hypothetical protein [Oscillospiraceae bacterium]